MASATRSSPSMGPSVSVIMALTKVKKSTLRYKKEFQRTLRGQRTCPLTLATSDRLGRSLESTRHKPRLIETQNLLPTIALPALPPCPWRETEREALALFDDPRIRSAEERQVLCVGCDTWCTLRDTYYMEDWEAHAGSCAALKAQGIKLRKQPEYTPKWEDPDMILPNGSGYPPEIRRRRLSFSAESKDGRRP